MGCIGTKEKKMEASMGHVVGVSRGMKVGRLVFSFQGVELRVWNS